VDDEAGEQANDKCVVGNQVGDVTVGNVEFDVLDMGRVREYNVPAVVDDEIDMVHLEAVSNVTGAERPKGLDSHGCIHLFLRNWVDVL